MIIIIKHTEKNEFRYTLWQMFDNDANKLAFEMDVDTYL